MVNYYKKHKINEGPLGALSVKIWQTSEQNCGSSCLLKNPKLKKRKYSPKFEKLVNHQKKHKPNGGLLDAPSVKSW